jgi:MFS family permease
MARFKASASPRRVAIGGLLALALAMGIGRFAFTPVLPFMVRDGLLDIAHGSWVAAANYVGYLVGAVLAARVRVAPRALAIGSIGLVAVTTAAMAWPGFVPWLLLRLLAGVASACVFVTTSDWCLGTLHRMRRDDLAPAVYSGVGLGIAAAGAYCLAAAVLHLPAGTTWVHLGLGAALLAVPVVRVLRGVDPVIAARSKHASAAAGIPSGCVGLVVCYGAMGFGYILPATFLPELARSVVEDPRVFGLAWPAFGSMAAASTLLAGPAMRRFGRLRVWAVCQAAMALGAALPSVRRDGMTVFVSAVLVGGTFMVITLAGVQEIRARVPFHPGAWVGYLTAAFAAGQVAGPVLSAALLAGHSHRALALGLQAAAAALALSAVWLWAQSFSQRTKELPNAG